MGMPRYKAQMKFQGWKFGDVFESTDPWYAELAREGRLVVLLDEGQGPPAGGQEGSDGDGHDQVRREGVAEGHP